MERETQKNRETERGRQQRETHRETERKKHMGQLLKDTGQIKRYPYTRETTKNLNDKT